jgi:hypothetical protein
MPDQKPKDIFEEAGLDPNQWQIEPATRPAPPSVDMITPVIPQYFQGSLDPGLQHDVDFVNTALRSSSAPRFALMPLGLQSSALTSAQITSVAHSAATAGTGTGQGGSGGSGGGGGGTDSDQITLDIPNIFTPTTQTVTLPGPLAFTLAVEPFGTVLTSSAAFYNSAIAGGTGSITVTGGAPPPGTNYAVSAAVGASASAFEVFTNGTPAGWTALPQSSGDVPQYAQQLTTASSTTFSWGGAARIAAMTAYFTGTLPTFTPSATGTGANSVSVAITGLTFGADLLIICGCALRDPVASGTMTDTQGNTPILVGTVGLPYSASYGLGAQIFMYLIQGVSSASDTITFSLSPASASNGIQMSVYEVPPTTPLGVPAFGPPPPPNLTGASGVLPPAAGGTGANLSLTGGASEVVMQTTVGGAFTVAQLAASDLSNGTTGSGAIVLSNSPTLGGSVIFTGKITSYNNLTTVSNGIPELVATIDLVNQAAAITPTTLYAVTAGRPGMYRISWVATVTQAATSSSTLGDFQILYTDFDTSVVKTMPGTPVAGVTNNSTNSTSTGTISGCFVAYVAASTTIQYQMGYASSGVTPMQYNLHIKAELLG